MRLPLVDDQPCHLEGSVDIDAAIIVLDCGVSTAVELCERIYKVALIEANRISWGLGRNGSQIIGGFGRNPSAFRMNIGDEGVDVVEKMSYECVDIVKQRIEKYNIQCDLKWGYCEVALKNRHLKDYRQWAEDEPEMVLLNRDEVRQYINSELYLGGYYREDWGISSRSICVLVRRVLQSKWVRKYLNSRG